MLWLAGLRQLEDTQRRVINLMHKTVLGQVASLLIDESGLRPEVELSQASIATLLGASRQTVNESLSRLKELDAVGTQVDHARGHVGMGDQVGFPQPVPAHHLKGRQATRLGQF